MIAATIQSYQRDFALFEQERAGKVPAWLRDLRQSGLERFTELGFPTTRDEEWRYTNIAPLAAHSYSKPAERGASSSLIDALLNQAALDESFHRLVFVNGIFAAEWSKSDGVSQGVLVESLAKAISRHPDNLEQRLARFASFEQAAFTALNTAFVDDGAYVSIPDGVHLEQPVHLIFLSTVETAPIVSHPRILVSMGRGSRASVIESYFALASEPYFTNVVTEVEMAESAELDHYKLQHEQSNALHVASTAVRQEADSRLRSHRFSFGGSLSRDELNCVLDGEEIECTLNGLYMPTGGQHMDCRTRIDHVRANCSSYELYKGVLDDHAKGVFNGKIFVHPDAQKTDAKQSNQALLLSEDAVIDTKPQLEIYADDVKCTHGATVGELDDESLYYLRSRGIPESYARTMLVFAFANEVVQSIAVDAIRSRMESTLLADRGLPDV